MMDGRLTGTDTLSGNLAGEQSITGSLAGFSGFPVGTMDYERLSNKPMIEGVELEGDKTFEDLNLHTLTNEELEALLV